jgi:hypothetical protein
MKKYLLPIAFMAVACGQDDGNSFLTENELNLRGRWQLQSITRNGVPYDAGPCSAQNSVEFKDSGAYAQLNYGMLTGACAIDSVINGSYEFANDSIFISINYPDTLYNAAILEVTPQTLRLNSRIYMGEEDPGTDEISFTRVN